MKWTLLVCTTFLAIVLTVWMGPSVWGSKVLVPLDLLWEYRPNTPPAGMNGVRNSLIGDQLYENFMWKTLARRAAAAGELPLWDPFSFCGHPLYATGQASTFYPFNLIFILLPLPLAYTVYTWLHLWAGGVFQYMFLRRIGVGGFGSAIGGLIFGLCGFFTLRLIWPMLIGSGIWLPLMLLCIVWLSESQRVGQAAGRVAVTSVVFALPLLAGFLEIAFYAYMVAGLFTLARCWPLWVETRSFRRCAGLCGQALAVVALAVMLAGPQLWPFLEVKDRNIRSEDIDYDKVVARALKAEHLLPLIVPDIFGNPAKQILRLVREMRPDIPMIED